MGELAQQLEGMTMTTRDHNGYRVLGSEELSGINPQLGVRWNEICSRRSGYSALHSIRRQGVSGLRFGVRLS